MNKTFYTHEVHCVCICYRIQERDLTGQRPSEVRCGNCNSAKIAIWKGGECIYSYNGKVDYPYGRTPFGTSVTGPTQAVKD